MSRTRYIPPRLHISASTWTRDSNGLYDYDSRNVFHQSFRANGTSQVIRTGNHCMVIHSDHLMPNAEVLVNVISAGGDRYVIQEAKGSHKLWTVVKSLHGRIPGAELNEGDFIRFGKILMVVKRVSTKVGELPRSLREKKTLGKQDTSENNETHTINEPGQCRICLGETYTSENPFLSPCACDGSMKFIHLLCLREWLKNKLTVRESGAVVAYSWHSMTCELCKAILPETVLCGGVPVDLIDFHQPESSYIMLEESNETRELEKMMYVVSLYEGDSIRIGRGHDSEIRVADISVSRLHATIKYKEGKFWLEDKNSKFGTLAQAKGGVTVNRTNSIGVQVSRTVLDFSVIRDVSALLKCCICCVKRSAQVIPDRAAETFTDNEREVPAAEEEEVRDASAANFSRRSGEADASVAPQAGANL